MRGIRQFYLGRWLLCLMVLALCCGYTAAGAEDQQTAPPQGLVAVNAPRSLPEFNLPSLDGAPLRSADLHGKVVVVRFWATW